MLGTVDLVFTAGNDADAQPTSFWIDGVRLCMTWGDPQQRQYLPLLLNATNHVHGVALRSPSAGDIEQRGSGLVRRLGLSLGDRDRQTTQAK